MSDRLSQSTESALKKESSLYLMVATVSVAIGSYFFYSKYKKEQILKERLNELEQKIEKNMYKQKDNDGVQRQTVEEMKTEEHGDDFDDMNDSFDYDDFDKNIQDYITATPELIDLNEYQRKHELNVMNLKSRMLKKLHKTEKLNYT